jgi:hypothetical protein
MEGTPDDIDAKNSAFLMKEWEEQMTDFSPDDFITFEILTKSVEILEEYISRPTKIRGAFYTSLFISSYIDFSVL